MPKIELEGLKSFHRGGNRPSKEMEGEREKQVQYANTYIWNLRENKGHEEPSGKTGIKTQTY